MSWWSTIIGFFTGAGSIAGAVEEVAKVADDVTKEVHDKNQRDAGAQAQREVTDDAEIKEAERVAAPVPTADVDKLWDEDKAKFGPSGS